MKADYARLRLKYHGNPEKLDEILQLECREKAEDKIPDFIKNPDFRFPSLAAAEMATSKDIAELHVAIAGKPTTLLDMTCGLGVDAFTLAGAGFSVKTFDIDHASAETAMHNARVLGLDNIDVRDGDSVEFLRGTNEKFGVIFIDPARRDAKGRHYALADCHPNVMELMPLLTSGCEKLVIKASPMANPAELDGLQFNTHIIGTTRECKEVVFEIFKGAEGKIVCHTIGHGEHRYSHEVPTTGTPEVGDYLLVPYPAVMKAGGNVTCSGAVKIARFSHLYFSKETLSDFPGEAKLIREILPFDKATVKNLPKIYPKLNVSVRNFPLTAPELVKKLKIKEGGNDFMFATTTTDGKKILIITSGSI